MGSRHSRSLVRYGNTAVTIAILIENLARLHVLRISSPDPQWDFVHLSANPPEEHLCTEP
jgi:hypothetical protein